MHSPNWKCANGYLELFLESPRGEYITFAKFDATSAGVSSGAGTVVVARRDGSSPLILPPAVRVSTTLYGAFQQWLGGGEDLVTFGNQPNRLLNEGTGYVYTPRGELVATFPGVPRCANPANQRQVVCSAHESLHETATRGHVWVIDVFTGEKTVGATIQDAIDYYGVGATLPGTWDDIYSKHPKWSPDGQKIVFSWGHDPDTGLWRKLFVIRLDKGGAIEHLMDYENAHHHIWHPNSQEVCMVDTSAAPTKFVAVDIETKASRTLITSVSGFSSHGSISPDGRFVATDVTSADGPVVIHQLGASLPGSVRRVYKNAAMDAAADLHCHIQWTRDSRAIFFAAENHRIYEWAPGATPALPLNSA